MKFISNNNITDPAINLAMEEYVLTNLMDDSYFLFYINEPSIIIGKNQNTYAEVNQAYVDEHHIHVIRRISGGGAVYHDLGNLNFSFVTQADEDSFHNFKRFTMPIVEALNEMGVAAELSGRNDLQVGERKISGNAMFQSKNRMFSHGTLMLNSDVEEVVRSLTVNEEKLITKGIRSIRSRVANISEFLDEPITIEDFKVRLLDHIFEGHVEEYKLTDEDWEAIHQLSRKKYQTFEWNYGKNPQYNYEVRQKFPGGLLELKMNVRKGMIDEIRIFGDFFGVGEITDIEQRLIGVPHQKQAVADKLQDIDFAHYFGRVTKEEFLSLLS
ncbi:lipoate--protein ligase [Macrococcus equipercicus]|uniref:lipoate--protein ligase n=1 Tax=Macrococcus equipercicus TaxID=69967 RepID=A0A9Q9F0U4_9STAP|nr:lipoate--protein ligase [Macrococcus equipercicus]KAA1039156.1 lipoate--protein ligase [Macrococcus equipercicus]UTH13333.1 lipoate--protein ligase [Macrococcus equipercicus]